MGTLRFITTPSYWPMSFGSRLLPYTGMMQGEATDTLIFRSSVGRLREPAPPLPERSSECQVPFTNGYPLQYPPKKRPPISHLATCSCSLRGESLRSWDSHCGPVQPCLPARQVAAGRHPLQGHDLRLSQFCFIEIKGQGRNARRLTGSCPWSQREPLTR